MHSKPKLGKFDYDKIENENGMMQKGNKCWGTEVRQ